MRKNRRLTERFGIHEGDRVRLMCRGDTRSEEADINSIHEIKGEVYQIYRDFVVIKTKFGTHPSFLWSDFLKWRTE